MIKEIVKGASSRETCVSKHNHVSLIRSATGDFYIWKKMKSEELFQHEKEVLEILYNHGVAVPRIIESGDRELLLEYIEGTLFIDEFEKMESRISDEKEIQNCIEKLLEWLTQFYKAMEEVYGVTMTLQDVNFRNYILHNNQVYGIDFERCAQGEVADDLGKIAAFALMYEPRETKWKKQFVQCFTDMCVKTMDVSLVQIEEAFEKELLEICRRRGIEL